MAGARSAFKIHAGRRLWLFDLEDLTNHSASHFSPLPFHFSRLPSPPIRVITPHRQVTNRCNTASRVHLDLQKFLDLQKRLKRGFPFAAEPAVQRPFIHPNLSTEYSACLGEIRSGEKTFLLAGPRLPQISSEARRTASYIRMPIPRCWSIPFSVRAIIACCFAPHHSTKVCRIDSAAVFPESGSQLSR